MRQMLLLLVLSGSALASEPQYPLWDGHESVADYVRRVHLPPTKTLDLGGGVKLDLVLIPAGKFIMGTPEPTPVDEEGLRKKIVTGQALLASSAVALLIMLAVVIVRAIRKKRRPQLSLTLLLLVTIAAGSCVLSGLHWRQSELRLAAAMIEYATAQARFQSANENEKPAHPVTLTRSFYMGKFVVTQEQWQQVMGALPTYCTYKGKDYPVEMMSWADAQLFCNKLTEQTKQTIRLPTEAEWEYACRAGTTTAYYSGDTDADLARVAWYVGNSKGMNPVGQKDANAFGLYDMLGNVGQWCQDLWDENYYSKSPAEDPNGPEQGTQRLLRGGTWNLKPIHCRAALRDHCEPRYLRGSGGFRVVLMVSGAE
jgi:formylglycine-generating enzyme required for sulfatase activity